MRSSVSGVSRKAVHERFGPNSRAPRRGHQGGRDLVIGVHGRAHGPVTGDQESTTAYSAGRESIASV